MNFVVHKHGFVSALVFWGLHSEAIQNIMPSENVRLSKLHVHIAQLTFNFELYTVLRVLWGAFRVRIGFYYSLPVFFFGGET